MITENVPITNWQARETPEEVLEPDLPIVDPHHHLWDLRALESPGHAGFEQKVYLCEEFTNDIRDAGHNVVQTVFAQCGAFYRADGPEHMRCVGETEFVHSIAAMSRSGLSDRPASAPVSSPTPTSDWARPWNRCCRRTWRHPRISAAFAPGSPPI